MISFNIANKHTISTTATTTKTLKKKDKPTHNMQNVR